MVVDVSDIRKEGWISKESAVLRSYRKRWMVLTPERLYSFKRERVYADPTEARAAAGWAVLHNCDAAHCLWPAPVHRRSTCGSVAR